MWVHPAVAGATLFPGACLSFPTVCLKSVEGGAVNNVGTFRTGLCWEIAAGMQNIEYLCEEQMMNWLEAEREAVPLTLSPPNFHRPPALSTRLNACMSRVKAVLAGAPSPAAQAPAVGGRQCAT